MVFWRGFPRVKSQDLKILSNSSFYIDTYPIWAKIGENGYYGCNLRFLVVYEIFWWNSDLFRALNFVNRSSGSKVMHKWPRAIYIFIYIYIHLYIFIYIYTIIQVKVAVANSRGLQTPQSHSCCPLLIHITHNVFCAVLFEQLCTMYF